MKEEWHKAYERYLSEVKQSSGRIAPLYFAEAIKHADSVVQSLARAERLNYGAKND